MSRLGIDPRWLGVWQQQLRFNEQSWRNVGEVDQTGLENYAATGSTGDEDDDRVEKYAIPEATWEPYLHSYLAGWAAHRRMDFERRVAEVSAWSSALAAESFVADYTSRMIDLYIHALFPTRFKGRILQMLSLKNVATSAFGFVAASEAHGLNLARLQARAFAKGYFFDDKSYPIFAFMLNLFADYLGEPLIPLSEKQQTEPSLVWLGANWRHPEAVALEEACLEACDYHTWRCAPTEVDFNEFDTGAWMRIPIEMLLMFKLREKLGLDNPKIEHPLFEVLPDRIPAPHGFQPDELVSRVRARMHQDGYDESAIARLYEIAP